MAWHGMTIAAVRFLINFNDPLGNTRYLTHPIHTYLLPPGVTQEKDSPFIPKQPPPPKNNTDY